MGQAINLQNEERQRALEKRLEQTWAQPIDQEATLADTFGPPEAWVLQLGEQRLLLHPVQKQWLIYDRLHDTWQPSGIEPGQGIFVVRDRRLGLQRQPGEGAAQGRPANPDEAQEGAHGGRGEESSHGMRPDEEQKEGRPEPKFCPGCGKAVRPGQRFCNGCGRELVKKG